jgi:hypothetical protein
MARLARTIYPWLQCTGALGIVLLDAVRFLRLCLRPRAALAAENLFLRKQLALYQEHHGKPRGATNATRLTLVWLSPWFDWQSALVAVQPETFQRWRRRGRQLFWRGTAYPGRPPIPVELQGLIRQMARDNLTWGQRRIANELRLKLGLQVSPHTVREYMPTYRDRAPGHRVPSQRWRTFVRNHASVLIVRGMAADLLTRGVQALVARLMRPLQQWWDRSVASRVPGTAQGARWPLSCCAIPYRHVQRGLQIPAMGSAWWSGARRTWRRHLTMIAAPPPEPPRWTRSSCVLLSLPLTGGTGPALTHVAPSSGVMERRRLPPLQRVA